MTNCRSTTTFCMQTRLLGCLTLRGCDSLTNWSWWKSVGVSAETKNSWQESCVQQQHRSPPGWRLKLPRRHSAKSNRAVTCGCSCLNSRKEEGVKSGAERARSQVHARLRESERACAYTCACTLLALLLQWPAYWGDAPVRHFYRAFIWWSGDRRRSEVETLNELCRRFNLALVCSLHCIEQWLGWIWRILFKFLFIVII